MRENGQVIIAVEPNGAAGQMKLQAVKTSDGNSWWAVFTSFDEELKRQRKRYVNLYDRHRKSTGDSAVRGRNQRRDHQSLEPDIDAGQDIDSDRAWRCDTVSY